MAKRIRTTRTRSYRQGRRRASASGVLADELIGLAQQPSGPMANTGDGTMQAQAARLADPRLQTVQRQDLAAQIGRVQGNQHLQRVVASLAGDERAAVQREDNPTEAITAPPGTETTEEQMSSSPEELVPDSEIVATSFGTFLVYRDDFVGPLPSADYAADLFWPVRQSVFNRIQSVIKSIEAGGAGIQIEGDNAFASSVLLDLAWLMTQNIGRELLEAIAWTDCELTIQETNGGNACSYNPDADSWENPDGTPGPGANITVEYNPQEWNPYGGNENWMTRPPPIGLAHELVHAWTGMTGMRARGETGGVRRRELQATGLGEYTRLVYTENRFRAAFNLSPRPRY